LFLSFVPFIDGFDSELKRREKARERESRKAKTAPPPTTTIDQNNVKDEDLNPNVCPYHSLTFLLLT
jgi:hypothetical protein